LWTIWSERWRPPEEWLGSIEAELRANGATVVRGGDYDAWDLEVRGGALGSARIRALIEEHGGDRQLVRLRSDPRFSKVGFAVSALLALLAGTAELNRAWPAAVILFLLAAVLTLRELQECAGATAEVIQAVEERTARSATMPRALQEATTGRS
jgi:hypothetical protein